jgi:hypothetical protein
MIALADRSYRLTGTISGWVTVLVSSLVLGLSFGTIGYVLPFLGPGFIAFVIGTHSAQAIFENGKRFKRAIRACQAALAYDRTLSDFWFRLHWRELEIEVANLFQRRGYDAMATPSSNDRGVDVVATRGTEKIVIQCKQYAKPAQRNLVSELIGVLTAEGASRAILVCTGGFTSGAEDYAAINGVELWDVEDLRRFCRTSSG